MSVNRSLERTLSFVSTEPAESLPSQSPIDLDPFDCIEGDSVPSVPSNPSVQEQMQRWDSFPSVPNNPSTQRTLNLLSQCGGPWNHRDLYVLNGPCEQTVPEIELLEPSKSPQIEKVASSSEDQLVPEEIHSSETG
ncbi:MAG: hypothetical protein S4CHLAM7_06710 [Chlamydiae bacterium]|nr:hypothetical protein [Chlamydiota bacterium]